MEMQTGRQLIVAQRQDRLDQTGDSGRRVEMADMLTVAHMGLHVAQMTGVDQIDACFDAVTINAARIMHLDDYGLAAGKSADMVLLQAKSRFEALRLNPARLTVIRRGKVVSQTEKVSPSINVGF